MFSKNAQKKGKNAKKSKGCMMLYNLYIKSMPHTLCVNEHVFFCKKVTLAILGEEKSTKIFVLPGEIFHPDCKAPLYFSISARGKNPTKLN